MPSAADLLALQQALAGEYVIEKELGRGGMGIVYLARDVALERSVAIKVLPPEYAVRSELRERFLREARTAGKLSHPNVVPVHRADDVGGFVFFVMAFVEGETLGQRLRTKGPLTPAVAARVLREVAWALAYAHARGVIHRDVKPDNILIERETGRALVTDFGIALRSDMNAITDEGTVMGTAQFMSPEQASGEDIDGRSDLYSLGIVGYLALTGELPFEGPNVQAILAKHLTQPHPPLTGRVGVPDPLAKALDKCLLKSPDSRWATGEMLADAIGDATPSANAIPAPIRVWLTKGSWIGPIGAVCYLILALRLLNGDLFYWSTFATAIGPVVLYAVINTALVRRALDAGYGYEDLISGLRIDLETRREDRRFDVSRDPPLAFKVIRGTTYLAWATLAAVFVFSAIDRTADAAWTYLRRYGGQFGWVIFVAVAGSIIGLMFPGRRLSERDWTSSLRWRFWHGPIGRALVRVSAIGGNARTVATASSRPTEIAIGLAAQDLYDALPRVTQQRFRDLPRVVRRLEDDAQAIRGRLTTITGSISSATGAKSEAHQAVVHDLQRAKDREQQRLNSTLAALDSIRLDLLRLSAGVGDAESLTKTMSTAAILRAEFDAAARPVS